MHLVEDGGVQQPPRPGATPTIGGGAARREPQGEVHDLLPVIEARVEDGLARFDGANLGADALLLAPEHEVLDLGFELVGEDAALLAAGAVTAVLLPQAVEVRVRALRALDRESPPADSADEHALGVVVLPALARAAHGPGGEQLLHLVEGAPLDERLVAAFVLDPVPFHDPDVSPVSEKAGQPGDGDRLGRVVAAAAPIAKAAVGHLVGQALDGPLSGGVQLEGSFDERSALGIGDDVGWDYPRSEDVLGEASGHLADGGGDPGPGPPRAGDRPRRWTRDLADGGTCSEHPRPPGAARRRADGLGGPLVGRS